MDLKTKRRELKRYYKIVKVDCGVHIKAICNRCGKEIELAYCTDGFLHTNGYSDVEESLDDIIKQNNIAYYSDDKKPYCTGCRELNTWEIIFKFYLNAYSNDEHMVSAIKDIHRYVSIVHTLINPAKFEQMLKDRFITPTQNEINVWNLAVDECKILSKMNYSEFTVPSKWRENKVANGILGFLGF